MLSIRRHVALINLLVFLSLAGSIAAAAPAESEPSQDHFFQWSQLPDLPQDAGRAGSFAGVSNGTLIVAGGTGPISSKESSQAEPRWLDTIDVLSDPKSEWKTCSTHLPHPLAFGVSITTDEGVVCLGGSDGRKHYADAFLLKGVDKQLVVQSLPDLPCPVAYACGATIGKTIYVAGGLQSPDATKTLKTFWALDLSKPAKERQWQALKSWPGPGRMMAVAGVQDGSFFLVGGAERVRDPDSGQLRLEPLTDGYRYAPEKKSWTPIASLPGEMVGTPTPAAPLGQSHLAFFGTGIAPSRLPLVVKPSETAPSNEVLAYHTITDTWRVIGHEPAMRFAAPVVTWDKKIILPGGETDSETTSPRIDVACSVPERASFGWANYSTLVLYLLAVMALGCWFSFRNKNTDDFFRGGQRVPWWAAGISIFATMSSSISYMAVPAKSFATDWSYLFTTLGIVLVQPLVVWFYLPVYRQLNVTSAYEYLETRFNLAVRWFGSLSFMLFQIGRMAIVLFLPALALATVSDIDITSCILLMGILCVLYVMLGGIEAVIWTDVMQTVVLLGGVFVVLALVIHDTEGGLSTIYHTTQVNNKFLGDLDWSWDMTAATVWVLLLGNILSNLTPYTASQDVVQRYITTKDTRLAARSIWTNAIMVLPASALFFAMGTALFAFYKMHPERLDPSMQTDAILPLFIIREIPAGLAGLMVAGIFAASQSTLSSSLNSVATCWVTDFSKRLNSRRSDRDNLRLARIITLVIGLAVTAVACGMAELNIGSLWDTYFKILNLTGSALAGLFVLGLFTRRANGRGAAIGAIASVASLYCVQQFTNLHFFLYAGVGITVCVVVGWCASWFVGPRPENLDRLTVYTKQRDPVQENVEK